MPQGFNEILFSGRSPLLTLDVSGDLFPDRVHGSGGGRPFSPETFGTLEDLQGARIQKELAFLTSPDMRGK
jgi:hypothetical protein